MLCCMVIVSIGESGNTELSVERKLPQKNFLLNNSLLFLKAVD